MIKLNLCFVHRHSASLPASSTGIKGKAAEEVDIGIHIEERRHVSNFSIRRKVPDHLEQEPDSFLVGAV